MRDEPEVITLDSSSDEDEDNLSPLVFLEDWGTQTPIEDPGLHHESSAIDPHIQYEDCLQSIIECFPDISHDYVQTLYGEYLGSVELTEAGAATEILIGRILDQKSYPKEKDRLKDLKRKRSPGEVDDAAEAAKWKTKVQNVHATTYTKISRTALQETFPLVPLRYIDAKFKEHGNLYGAYHDIADTERRYSQLESRPYTKLKSRRLFGGPSHDDLMRRIRHKEGVNGEMLELELQAAHEKRVRDDDAFEIEAREKAVTAAMEQEERDRGEVMECGCCFDTIPMSKITQCNAETAHFFCCSCARMNAENDIGLNRFALTCMDSSGCQATFSKTERCKFMDERTLAKLDSLEQQASIQGAMSEFFDFVTCPFCEYGHICPPVEEDKEFRCGFPDCREVSCRLCKERTHVPMTCEEFKRDQGVSERHLIEEARTEALLRSCPKCKVRILKEDGCNKVVCTTCRSAICDYCGKDISSEQYAHFEGRGDPTIATSKNSKCPLYDTVKDRKDQQIGAAEQQAKEKIRKENPDISEADLEIRFSSEVKGSNLEQFANPFFADPMPNVLPPPRRHRFHAARHPVHRYPAVREGLAPPLGPIVNQPVPQPQPPHHDPGRPALDMWEPMFLNEAAPENFAAMPPPPYEAQRQQLNANNHHAMNVQQLEGEAVLRRQRMRELQQQQMARLLEQRQLRAQLDALRQALPAFEVPARPHVRDPFYAQGGPFNPQGIGDPPDPADAIPRRRPRQAVFAAHLRPGTNILAHRNQQPNANHNDNQENLIAVARRNRHRHPPLQG